MRWTKKVSKFCINFSLCQSAVESFVLMSPHELIHWPFGENKIRHNCTHLDIDDISDFVHFHVRRKWDNTVLFVWTREHVPCTTTITLWVCHFEWFVVSAIKKINEKLFELNGQEIIFSFVALNTAPHTKVQSIKMCFFHDLLWQATCDSFAQNTIQLKLDTHQRRRIFFFALAVVSGHKCVRIYQIVNCAKCNWNRLDFCTNLIDPQCVAIDLLIANKINRF